MVNQAFLSVNRYMVAVLSMCLMLVLRGALDPWLSGDVPLITLYGGVAIAVWYGGYRPALLSAVFGFLGADYLFTAPRHQFGPLGGHFWIMLLAYTVSSGAIIAFGEAMRIARRRLRKSEQRLAKRTLELQQTNKHLREVGERLSEAQRIAGIGSWENDLLRDEGEWSDECFRILGYAPHTFKPSFRQFQQRVHPDDLLKVLESVKTTRPGHEHIDVEFRIIRPDGEERMLHSLGEVVFDDNGCALQVVGTVEDITERKKMEQILRDNQADLNRAQAMGQIGSWRFDIRQNKATWSEENHRILGIPKGTSITYETFLSAVHPDDREHVNQKWQAALRGEPYDIEHRLIVDGKVKWARERAELELDQEGMVVASFGTTQDITKRKQAEEALLEADHRKNEFLAILAHELRNPLTPICNAGAILKLHDAPDSTRQAAQDLIDRQLQYMVRLIDDLMDVSRITRGKLQLRKKRVDLVALLDQVVEIARSHVEETGHVLTVSLPPQPIHLDADPVRLTQVFQNLLNNACKYTEKGGKIVLVAERDGTNVVVKVTDTGIGIPSELLPDIFELFSQIPSALKQVENGLGIGLSLAQNLVEMHGGSIEVKSDGVGKGSKFIVRLPVLDESTASPSNPPPQDGDELKSGALRVLVADDSRDVSKSLVMLLELWGHEVAMAYDGQQAIETSAQFHPDVVLLDIGMPKLDGYSACRSIRQQPWGKDIKIFALTGLGGDDVLHKSKESGFTGHLVKPVDSAVLLRLLADQYAAMT